MDYHDVNLTPGTLYADINTRSNAAPAAALSVQTLQQYAEAAGFQGNDATVAAQIAIVESSGVPNVVAANDSNGQGGSQASWGLWQISLGTHTAPIGWADPATNAKLAFAKYQGAGNTFAPWANSYATVTGHSATAKPGSSSNFLDEVNNVVNEGEQFIVGGVEALGKDILGAAEGAGSMLLAPLKFTAGAIACASNILENFGPFIIGLLLIIIGGMMLAQAHRDEFNAAAGKVADSLGTVAQAATQILEKVPIE